MAIARRQPSLQLGSRGLRLPGGRDRCPRIPEERPLRDTLLASCQQLEAPLLEARVLLAGFKPGRWQHDLCCHRITQQQSNSLRCSHRSMICAVIGTVNSAPPFSMPLISPSRGCSLMRSCTFGKRCCSATLSAGKKHMQSYKYGVRHILRVRCMMDNSIDDQFGRVEDPCRCPPQRCELCFSSVSRFSLVLLQATQI